MEHRWGKRRTMDVGVKLYAGASLSNLGRLLNVSASGAYVGAGAALPIMTRVYVTLARDGLPGRNRQRIPGYVVRSDGHGIGIEWQEFAPAPVLALLESLQAQQAHEARRLAAGAEPRAVALRAPQRSTVRDLVVFAIRPAADPRFIVKHQPGLLPPPSNTA